MVKVARGTLLFPLDVLPHKRCKQNVAAPLRGRTYATVAVRPSRFPTERSKTVLHLPVDLGACVLLKVCRLRRQ